MDAEEISMLVRNHNDAVELARRAQQELKLIRDKDCDAVYDVLIRSELSNFFRPPSDSKEVAGLCIICGTEADVYPDYPALAICPDCCDEHTFEYDCSRHSKYCKYCDKCYED